ncbi:DUF6861 domain-containing protein [Pseudomonas avellanae]|uniref:DUF6861 domain-containing protein n=2 Tax=Pseudomonas avellanae TaxID=46257 RepID=UPI0005C81DAF|nr:HNH/ENDO VII family nuclease [Pseudomonas avellanae]UQW71985.1 HNH/ENDO VII family nuclease [Pseudomonas avellanae]
MWDDIERTLDNKFNHLNQSFDDGWESAYDGWNGFTRRVSNEATLAFGSIGGNRIESVKLAMAKSYPIIQLSLMRKWSSIDIAEILPVLLKLVKEVAMIMGGSVAVGTLVGAAAGSLAFGAGAIPGAIAGSGIGVQVGNLILLGMGLSAIAEYFYQGLPACLATLYEGIVTAWNAEEGVKPPGLDPTGASAWLIDERIDAAARKLAKGQEQLVMLLLTAIVTYITRGQVKAGIVGSLDGIAARSAKLQADMTNKQIAGWLARNEQRLLAHPELRMPEPAPLRRAETPLVDEHYKKPYSKPEPERPAKKFSAPKRSFWSKPPIEFKGNRVSQRDDLFDPDLMTTWRERGKLVQGTNLERMASGRAPIGVDGESINLHHMIQTQSGGIAELRNLRTSLKYAKIA